MRKSLKRIGNLQLLEQILDRSLSENEDITTKYIDSLAPIFYYILLYYIKKDNIYTSYAVFFIGKYKLYDCTEKEKIQDILLNLLDEPSVFCREAVLKIFYQKQNYWY